MHRVALIRKSGLLILAFKVTSTTSKPTYYGDYYNTSNEEQKDPDS